MPFQLGPRRGLAAALLAAALAGCGAGGPPPSLSAHAASQMRAHLAAARMSAAGGDARGTTRALDAFTADVAEQKSAGHLSASAYASFETGIERARQRVAVDVPAPSAAPAGTPVPPQSGAAPAEGGNGNHHGNGSGHGRGRGHGKGEGGD